MPGDARRHVAAARRQPSALRCARRVQRAVGIRSRITARFSHARRPAGRRGRAMPPTARGRAARPARRPRRSPTAPGMLRAARAAPNDATVVRLASSERGQRVGVGVAASRAGGRRRARSSSRSRRPAAGRPGAGCRAPRRATASAGEHDQHRRGDRHRRRAAAGARERRCAREQQRDRERAERRLPHRFAQVARVERIELGA